MAYIRSGSGKGPYGRQALLAMAIALTLLAGCGGSEEPTPEPSPTPEDFEADFDPNEDHYRGEDEGLPAEEAPAPVVSEDPGTTTAQQPPAPEAAAGIDARPECVALSEAQTAANTRAKAGDVRAMQEEAAIQVERQLRGCNEPATQQELDARRQQEEEQARRIREEQPERYLTELIYQTPMIPASESIDIGQACTAQPPFRGACIGEVTVASLAKACYLYASMTPSGEIKVSDGIEQAPPRSPWSGARYICPGFGEIDIHARTQDDTTTADIVNLRSFACVPAGASLELDSGLGSMLAERFGQGLKMQASSVGLTLAMPYPDEAGEASAAFTQIIAKLEPSAFAALDDAGQELTDVFKTQGFQRNHQFIGRGPRECVEGELFLDVKLRPGNFDHLAKRFKERIDRAVREQNDEAVKRNVRF